MNDPCDGIAPAPTEISRIDIHAHLIPGVDDGPTDMESAVTIMAAARIDGTEIMVATPHVNSAFCRYADLDALKRLREEFQKSIEPISDIPRILFGAEVYLSAEIPGLLRDFRSLLTINGGDYLLVEFPLDYIFPHSRDLFYAIMQEGITPVIAHPERNEMVQRNPRIVFEFVEMGSLCQVDSGSITGEFGGDAQAAAFYLISANAAHLVASDTHDPYERPPRLSHAESILGRFGSDRRDFLLRRVPRAVIDNLAIPETGPLGGEPKPARFMQKLKGWFS